MWAKSGLILMLAVLVNCTQQFTNNTNLAPGVDQNKSAVDGMIVGERLMNAGEYELALDAFTRAAAEQGLTAEVLSAMGVANFRLGRIDQSIDLFRRALLIEPEWPGLLNNLGVSLMEKGDYAEAALTFQKAVALDNGENDSIRKNLRLALEKQELSVYSRDNNNNLDPQIPTGTGDTRFP